MGLRRRLLIIGGTLVDHLGMRAGDLVVDGGRIASVGKGKVGEIGGGDRVIRADRLFVCPGFIDLQVNGGVGCSFLDASGLQLSSILAFHVSHGTTGLLATMISSPTETVRDAIERLLELGDPQVLGIHLEGPFIAPERRGAHGLEFLRPPSLEMLEELCRGHEESIRLLTLAPERPGAGCLIARALELGVVVSLGHSNATYAETRHALSLGIRFMTHLFNGMPELGHREPGPVGSAFDSDVMVGLIVDGIHVHPAIVRLAIRMKGIDRICLVTDSSGATGATEGHFRLGGQEVLSRDGEVRLPSGVLAGSTLTMDAAVRNLIRFAHVSVSEAVCAATFNPAQLLQIGNRKGSLDEGMDADIVIMNELCEVQYTIVGGDLRYDARGGVHSQ